LNSGSFINFSGRRLPCIVLTSWHNCLVRGDLKKNSSH
jgi:hypothetical protein